MSFLSLGCATQALVADASTPPMNTNCTFETGFDWAIAKKPYDNFCSAITEDIFLSGYGVGRKLSWVENDLFEVTQKVQCLETHKHSKDRLAAPTTSGSKTPQLSISEALEDITCSHPPVLDSESVTQLELTNLQKALEKLSWHKVRLQTLKNKISNEPHRLSSFMRLYEADGPMDELDINLRWRPYVSQKGGLDRISPSTRELILAELPDRSELPSPVLWGSALGFGVGHARQGRFATTGWKYAILDSIILASLLRGVTNSDSNSLSLLVGIWGIPLSRGIQLMDVYDFNTIHNINIDTLKTWKYHGPRMISYQWTF